MRHRPFRAAAARSFRAAPRAARAAAPRDLEAHYEQVAQDMQDPEFAEFDETELLDNPSERRRREYDPDDARLDQHYEQIAEQFRLRAEGK